MTGSFSNNEPKAHTKQPSLVPIAWSPNDPYQLALVPQGSVVAGLGRSGDDAKLPVRNESMLKEAKCSDSELAALGIMIDKTEEYYQEKDLRIIGNAEACQQLSLQYRRALRNCLGELSVKYAQEQQSQTDMDTDDDDDDKTTDSVVRMEVFRATCMLLHIADVFLPVIPVSSSLLMGPDSAWGQQGRVTANFVRYLRIQHFRAPNSLPMFQEIQEARQPDGLGPQYWKIVERYVIAGGFVQAWKMLERHSMYQLALQQQRQQGGHGMDENMDSEQAYLTQRAAETLRAFSTLHDLMMMAPLPGGRDMDCDEGISLGYVKEVLDDIDADSGDLSVLPSDFRLWERAGTADETTMYSARHKDAMNKYKTWQGYVKGARQAFSPGTVPELTRILDLMIADSSNYEFTDWCDAMLVDLLFRKPDLRPRELVRRARKFIRLYSANARNLEPILSIMEGNVVKALRVLRSYATTGSGAALETTTTALVYNLFIEAGIMLPDDKPDLTMYLGEAACSVVAFVQDASVGVSLATRLLMPFALHDGNRTALALICEFLVHYMPKSDADAGMMISFCRPLTEKKSAAASDVCSDLALARYRSHVANFDYSMATQWLVDGVSLEQLAGRRGSCCRTLASHCVKLSTAVFKALANCDMDMSLDEYVSVKEVVETLKANPEISVTIYETQLLCMAVSIYEAMADKEENAAFPTQSIVLALEWMTDSSTHIRSTVAGPQMHACLLRLARRILESECSHDPVVGSSFSKNGLTVLSKSLQGLKASPLEHNEAEVAVMEQLILTALGRAEISANKQLKKRRPGSVWNGPDFSQVHSINLESHSTSTQEAVVRMMFEY